MKTIVYCEPHLAESIQKVIDDNEAAHLFEVRATPLCPKGRILVRTKEHQCSTAM